MKLPGVKSNNVAEFILQIILLVGITASPIELGQRQENRPLQGFGGKPAV